MRPHYTSEGPLCFYGGPFSNFVGGAIEIDGLSFRTVEHWFQSQKSIQPHVQAHIAAAPSAWMSKRRGRSCDLRPDWEEIKIDVMRKGLLAKFRQDGSMREFLLGTGDRSIHEDSPTDRIWGWFEGKGDDLLGKLLMEIRITLREEATK